MSFSIILCVEITEEQGLTARSRLSRGTASSASSCTEESALTVTDPLLTAKHKAH